MKYDNWLYKVFACRQGSDLSIAPGNDASHEARYLRATRYMRTKITTPISRTKQRPTRQWHRGKGV